MIGKELKHLKRGSNQQEQGITPVGYWIYKHTPEEENKLLLFCEAIWKKDGEPRLRHGNRLKSGRSQSPVDSRA
jgi:hypothetical protein